MPDSGDPANLSKKKVVFLGESKVGKTSLVVRFMYNEFYITYEPTVGVDFEAKTFNLQGDEAVRLQIWDTAGQDKFRSLIPAYIRDATMTVVVYDVTNVDSFLHTSYWIALVRREGGRSMNILLVGTKNDCEDERQVTTEEGQWRARELNVWFIETSAKANVNVTDLFLQVAVASPPPKNPSKEDLSTTDGSLKPEMVVTSTPEIETGEVTKPDVSSLEAENAELRKELEDVKEKLESKSKEFDVAKSILNAFRKLNGRLHNFFQSHNNNNDPDPHQLQKEFEKEVSPLNEELESLGESQSNLVSMGTGVA